jgi:hypothetical protein
MVEAEVLFLKPLSCTQFVQFSRAYNSLEFECNLNNHSRVFFPKLKEALLK